jgi:hypothetical protein
MSLPCMLVIAFFTAICVLLEINQRRLSSTGYHHCIDQRAGIAFTQHPTPIIVATNTLAKLVG